MPITDYSILEKMQPLIHGAEALLSWAIHPVTLAVGAILVYLVSWLRCRNPRTAAVTLLCFWGGGGLVATIVGLPVGIALWAKGHLMLNQSPAPRRLRDVPPDDREMFAMWARSYWIAMVGLVLFVGLPLMVDFAPGFTPGVGPVSFSAMIAGLLAGTGVLACAVMMLLAAANLAVVAYVVGKEGEGPGAGEHKVVSGA